jgi:hypothetical protein
MALRILFRQDLRERKGIRHNSRQRLKELIDAGEFPKPDGRTTSSPSSPPWWFETTIDRHLKNRAAQYAALRAIAEQRATTGQAEPGPPLTGEVRHLAQSKEIQERSASSDEGGRNRRARAHRRRRAAE